MCGNPANIEEKSLRMTQTNCETENNHIEQKLMMMLFISYFKAN